jgi:hypothetical protein
MFQEVVNQSGWSSGNAARFAIFNNATTGFYAANAGDYSGPDPDVATLSVTWSGGDGGGGEEQNFRNPGGGVSHVDGANFQV